MFQRLKEKVNAIATLEEGLWADIQAQAKIIEVEKHELLVRYGDKSKDVFFVAEGSFACSQVSESGKSTAIWFYFDDVFEFMATVDSLYNDEPTKYELKALKDSVVIKLPIAAVHHWADTSIAFGQLHRERIVMDFITVFEARSCLLTFTSLEFLGYIREKFPFIFEKLPGHYIADFMGITPEWYSKLQKKLDT